MLSIVSHKKHSIVSLNDFPPRFFRLSLLLLILQFKCLICLDDFDHKAYSPAEIGFSQL
jgi:hypothetical protein